MKKNEFINIENNIIYILKLDTFKVIDYFIKAVYQLKNQQITRICLDVSKLDSPIWANVQTPMAGLIDYFRQLEGINFDIIYLDKKYNMFDLHIINGSPLDTKEDVFNKIWKFNHKHIAELLKFYAQKILEKVHLKEGVLQSLEWCLSEVMDNIFNHAGVEEGYILGQLHPKSKHLVFAIYDNGSGIWNTLKNTKYLPKTPNAAIKIALQEGVTNGAGQGNGLFGLSQAVKYNPNCFLRVLSAAGFYELKSTDNPKEPLIKSSKNGFALSEERGCTLIDFQLNYNQEMDLGKIFFIGGRDYSKNKVVLYLNDIEADRNEKGNFFYYKLAEKKQGYGSRQAGKSYRTELLNLLNEFKQPVVIDFAGIGTTISSSFADEFIAKLMLEMGGFVPFNRVVNLRGTDAFADALIQKAIQQRLSSDYEQNKK